MSANSLLIAEKDMEYGRALARAISNLHSEFEVTISHIDEFDTDLKTARIDLGKFNLILIGGFSEQTAESSMERIPNNISIAIMTDYAVANLKMQADNPDRKFWYIYKYCNVNDIISDLYFMIAFQTGKKRFVEKGFAPEFIGFYSVCGGSGNTACAFGTSKELSRYHDKKVLYLSFEEMPASELMIRYHARSLTIGDYLYYLLETNNISLCCHPEGFTSSDDCGVESFSPSVGLNDLNDLSQEELIAFLKIISDSSRYDYVILDFNNRLSDETLFLMNLCSKIVVLQNDHPVSEYRTRKLIAYLTKQSNFADKNRFLRVVNQAGPEFPEPIGETGCKTICIEKDDNSFRYTEDHFEIDINHAFGIGIKKIADEIILVESGKEGAKCTGSFVQ